MLEVFIIKQQDLIFPGLICPLVYNVSDSSTFCTNWPRCFHEEEQLTSAGSTPGIRMSTEKLLDFMKVCCGLVADTQSV